MGIMQIQINTGHNVEGSEALSAHISEVVTHAMAHDVAHVTRVEVHLSDEKGPESGPAPHAMRCSMQARLECHQPLDVTCDAASLHEAIAGAADKLTRVVEHTLGKLRDGHRHGADVAPAAPAQP